MVAPSLEYLYENVLLADLQKAVATLTRVVADLLTFPPEKSYIHKILIAQTRSAPASFYDWSFREAITRSADLPPLGWITDIRSQKVAN